MYNFNEITSIHLEVTSKCQARCPMCPRRVQGGPMNPFVDLEEITLELFQKWIPPSLIKQLESLSMCGNLGDPILAKDTLKILQYVRQMNPSVDIQFHTNGSARPTEWWKQLAKLNVIITFGIDGLEDTHSLYRINTDFNKIVKNATAFISAGGRAVWDMLVFEHNEHQVDACRQLSIDLGFKSFKVKHTSRFKEQQLTVIDDSGKTVRVLYPTEKSRIITNKILEVKQEESPTISCKVVSQKQIYISAAGNVSPCCWLDMSWRPPMDDYRINYMDTIGEYFNLHEMTLEEIFKSGFFDNVKNTWESCSLKECARQCGSFNRLKAQFSND